MSMIHISHEGKELDIHLVLGNWRYITFEVHDDLTIDMKVPIGMNQEMIQRYLSMNQDYIVKEYDKKKNRNHQALPITMDLDEGRLIYHNGMLLPYLGHMKLRLCVKHVPQGQGTRIFVESGKNEEKILTIRTDNWEQDFLRYCIMRYYKKSAAIIVKRYVKEFSEKLRLPYRTVHITNLKTESRFHLPRFGYSNLAVKNQATLWGRCTRNHTLKFDWKLAMLPVEVIQYIIVHELTHVKKMGHSTAFWAEVERVMPEYKECGRWLDRHGKEYEIF